MALHKLWWDTPVEEVSIVVVVYVLWHGEHRAFVVEYIDNGGSIITTQLTYNNAEKCVLVRPNQNSVRGNILKNVLTHSSISEF